MKENGIHNQEKQVIKFTEDLYKLIDSNYKYKPRILKSDFMKLLH